MKIKGLCVCVNYTDLLTVSLDRWDTGLDDLLIVTSPADKATLSLCRSCRVPYYQTNVFYANGARFNKGAALSEAVIATDLRKWGEWLLLFDADIVPPADWRHTVDRCNPQPGRLYGAWRWENPEGTKLEDINWRNGRMIPQSWVIGYFCLFHLSDPRVPADPMFECHWTHAGNYDTSFSWLWPRGPAGLQEFLPIRTVHLGLQRENWLGRGRRDELVAMLGARQHFHDVDRERVTPPPLPGVSQ